MSKVTDKQKHKKNNLPIYYKTGRPTKYKKSYCNELIRYFDVPYFVEEERTKVVDGHFVKVKERVPNKLPLFESFAVRVCNVSVDTIQEWKKVHPEFSVAYKKAQAMQKDMLVYLALHGHFNTAYSIFLSKNITDLKDKVETDITSGGEKIESVNLTTFAKEIANKSIDELRREIQKQVDDKSEV